MIFQYTHEWIFQNSPHTGKPKTMTSRLVRPDQVLGRLGPRVAIFSNEQIVYAVGRDYAVTSHKDSQAIGRIRIVDIVQRDVRDYTIEDAHKEGFATLKDFMIVWVGMHDKPFMNVGRGRGRGMVFSFDNWDRMIKSRPRLHYRAWAITFEALVE